MKTKTKTFLTSCFAALVAFMLFNSSAFAQTPAVPSDTVSAIGEEPVAAAPQPVTRAPADLTAMPSDFPPPPAAVAAPASDPLVEPLPDPSNEESSGVATGGNVMGDTGVRPQHSGQFYDSVSLVPDSELTQAGVPGIRKVDPKYEPGQKYVVVEKGAAATSFEGQYVAATRALKLGRYPAAMEMFEKLYKQNHRDPRILMGLGVAQQGAGFAESAARTYEELLNVQPDSADAVINLMGIMKGQYPAVTLQRLLELRDKYPTNAGVPAQIGLVNAEMQNYDDAVRYLEIAATMQPQNSAHIYNLAIITDRQGNTREAIKLYERALELDASYGDSAQALPREEIYDRLVVLRRKV